MNPRNIGRENEEAKIQRAIIMELRMNCWFVKETHGNLYQSGLPDLFCCHTRYGHRWCEVKKPVGYAFTPAQLETFPLMCAHGSGVWVATSHIGIQELFMRPFNWFVYLQNARAIR